MDVSRPGYTPQGYTEAEFVSVPRATTILDALKFTGKSASGWSVGVLATTPGFESNDLGFNPRSDRWGGHVAVELWKPEPDGFTRFRALTVAKSYAYNFDGDKQGDAGNVFGRRR